MLVLTRKIGETVRIGGQIRVTVLRVSGGKVKLGFSGPTGIPIQREELLGASEGAGAWNDARGPQHGVELATPELVAPGSGAAESPKEIDR